ncbi:hypothetical protein JD844_018059 [Phrynosoma platyrhinos]|uniref:Tetraspanin n=1 Tax=Phrynosoma platyrhinos TaxID=52577 RepID=A0ABQ7SMT7_PHRPL|nr:hypothetical protein JD844_018059 [Phrynosoma platyrhinos]
MVQSIPTRKQNYIEFHNDPSWYTCDGFSHKLNPVCAPDTRMSCFTFLKVMMILFNLAIVLGGGALLGIGIWVSVDSGSFIKMFGPLSSSVFQFVNVGYLLIAIGAVLFLLGFLGCCGAQKESKCLLITFFSIILIIFIVEVAAAVVALVYTSLAETILQVTVTQLLKNEYGKNSDITTVWNTTMIELKCCGLSNYTDFNNSFYMQHHAGEYPSSCCKNKDPCDAVTARASDIPLAAMVVSMYLYCRLDEK